MNGLIDLEECLAKGLLRRITPSREKAFGCIDKAKSLLGEAKFDLENDQINSAVIVGYASLFDAARAILFRDGYREKSHACVVRYLEAKYSEDIPRDTILLLDRYRTCRHDTQYDVTYFPTAEEAKSVVVFAEGFIEKVKKIVGYAEPEA